MAKRATTKKSGRKSGAASPAVPGGFRRGGDPRQGRGPAKGAPNAGRPADAHKAWCQELVSGAKAEAAVRTVLENPGHPAFAAMWKAVTDRAYGKAPQAVEVSGPDGRDLVVTVTRRIVRAGTGA